MAQPSYGLVVDLSLLGDPRTSFDVLLRSAESAMLRLHVAELERQRVMDIIGALPQWCPDHIAPQTAHALATTVRRNALDSSLLRDRFLAIDLQLRVSLLAALWMAMQGENSPSISIPVAWDDKTRHATLHQLTPSNRTSPHLPHDPHSPSDPLPHQQSIARLSPHVSGHTTSNRQGKGNGPAPSTLNDEDNGPAPPTLNDKGDGPAPLSSQIGEDVSPPHMKSQPPQWENVDTLHHPGLASAKSSFWEDTVRRVFDMTHPNFFSPQMYAFGRETDRFDAWATVFRLLGTVQSDPGFTASLADIGARIATAALLAAAISEFCHKITVASQEVNAVVLGVERQRPPGQASTSPEHLRTRAHLSRYSALVESAGRSSIGRESLSKISGAFEAEVARSSESESRSSADRSRSGSILSDASQLSRGGSAHSSERFASVHSVEGFAAVFSSETLASRPQSSSETDTSKIQQSPSGSPNGSPLRGVMDLISGGAGTVQIVPVNLNEAVKIGQTSNEVVNSGSQSLNPLETVESSGQTVHSGNTTRITDSDQSGLAGNTLTDALIDTASFPKFTTSKDRRLPVFSPADLVALGNVFDNLSQVAVTTSTPINAQAIAVTTAAPIGDRVVQPQSPTEDLFVTLESATQNATGAAIQGKKPALARKRIRKSGVKPRAKTTDPKRATKVGKVAANVATCEANPATSEANVAVPEANADKRVAHGSSTVAVDSSASSIDVMGSSASAGPVAESHVSNEHLSKSTVPTNAVHTLSLESIINLDVVRSPVSPAPTSSLSATANLPAVDQLVDSTQAIVPANVRLVAHASSPSHGSSLPLSQTFASAQMLSSEHGLSPAQSVSPPKILDSAQALASAQHLSPMSNPAKHPFASGKPASVKHLFASDDSQKYFTIESAFEVVDDVEFDELESSVGDTEPQTTALSLRAGPNDNTTGKTQNNPGYLSASWQAVSLMESNGVATVVTHDITPSVAHNAMTPLVAPTATPADHTKMVNHPSKEAQSLYSETEIKPIKMTENELQSQSGSPGIQDRTRETSAGSNSPKTHKRPPDGLESKSPRKRGRPRKTKASEPSSVTNTGSTLRKRGRPRKINISKTSSMSELEDASSISSFKQRNTSAQPGDIPVTVQSREIFVPSYGNLSSASTVFPTADAQSAMSTLANDGAQSAVSALANDDREAYDFLSQSFNVPDPDPDAATQRFSPSEAHHAGSYDYRAGTRRNDSPIGNRSPSKSASAAENGIQSYPISLPSGGFGTYYTPATNRIMTSQTTPVSGTPHGASRGGLSHEGSNAHYGNDSNLHYSSRGNLHHVNNVSPHVSHATPIFYSRSDSYMNGDGQTRSSGLYSASTQYTDANSHTMSQTNGKPSQVASVSSSNSWPFPLNSQSHSDPTMNSLSPHGSGKLLPSPEILNQALSETRLNQSQFERINAASQANARRLHQEPGAYGPPVKQPPVRLSGWQISPVGSTPSLKSLGTTSSIPSSNMSTSLPSFPPPNQQTAAYEAASFSSPTHSYSPQIVHSSQGSPHHGQPLSMQYSNSSMQSQGPSVRGRGSPPRSQGSPLRSQTSPSRLSSRPSLYSPRQVASQVPRGLNASLRSSNDCQSTTSTVFRHATDYVYQNGPTSTYDTFFSSNESNARPSQDDDAPLMTQAFQ